MATEADNQLIPQSEYLPYIRFENNHFVNLDTFQSSPHTIVNHILKAHPISHALTFNPTESGIKVPELYVQQFWKTVSKHVNTRTNTTSLEAKIDQFSCNITTDVLRTVFQFPTATSRPPKTDFDPMPTDAEIIQGILDLGYSDPLPSVSKFKRTCLHPEYFIIFAILQRCMTAKSTGGDYPNGHQLRQFYGVVTDMHLDFAQLMLNDMIDVVNNMGKKGNRKTRRHLPFMRFTPMILQHIMANDANIPRRDGYPVVVCKAFKYTRSKAVAINVSPKPFPLSLLNKCDQSHPEVVEYRLRVGYASMERPEPVTPTQEAVAPSETLDVRTQSSTGDAERSVQRENIERGGEESEGETQIGITIIIEPHRSASVNRELIFADIEGEPESEFEDLDVLEQISETAADSNMFIGYGPVDVEMSEKENNDESENVRQENVSAETSPAQESREATSITGISIVSSGIETDVVIPTTQPQTPHSHSIFSQKEIVSTSHGDLAHNLLSSRSENVNIESGSTHLQTSAPLSTHIAIPQISEFLSIHSSTLDTVHALFTGKDARTSIVENLQGFGRGLDGSPARVTDITALTACGTASEAGTSTGNPSDPGTNVYLQEIVKGEINKALETIVKKMDEHQAANDAKFEKLLSAIQNQAPRQSEVPDYSIDDLKGMLHAKLLAKAPHRKQDYDLQQTLDAEQLYKSTNLEQFKKNLLDGMEDLGSTVFEGMKALEERVRVLETTCKTLASKRRHDDRDKDPDSHEGEKRPRTYFDR